MNEKLFKDEVEKLGHKLSEEDILKFGKYKDLLKEYNKKFNLTSIVDDENIYLKHFYDSLCLLRVLKVDDEYKILDIGTGAGFPGLPLSILMKKSNFVLVESNLKKCNFLKIVLKELNINNVNVVNSRAEEFVKENKNQFDIVTSRAVSNLFIISELEIPALKIGGLFLPLKSHVEEEIEISKGIINDLGATIENTISYELPIEKSKRTILCIRKNNETNNIYPREYNKIINDLKKLRK